MPIWLAARSPLRAIRSFFWNYSLWHLRPTRVRTTVHEVATCLSSPIIRERLENAHQISKYWLSLGYHIPT